MDRKVVEGIQRNLTTMKNIIKKIKKRFFKQDSLYIKEPPSQEGTPNIVIPNKKIHGLEIFINGEGNLIKIKNVGYFLSTIIIIEGNDNIVEIDGAKYLRFCKIFITGNKQRLFIDKGVKSEGTEFHLCCDSSECKIGQDCLFASNTEIWTGDGHTIYDIETGEIINKKKYIVSIDEHVWLANGVKLLKNCNLSKNIIVGANSVVTKKFSDQNCCIAGNPAVLVKSGINWLA